LSKTGVFLDRDDTLIKDVPYLDDPDMIELMPGAAEMISILNKKGIPVIMITNQSGISRGFFDEDALGEVHEELVSMLAAEGARLDGIYFCPHHPKGKIREYSIQCKCRKPEPGLLIKAADDLDLDLEKCYLVGDKADDMEAIHRVKGKAVLMKHQSKGDFAGMSKPDYKADNLKDALAWIMEDMGEPG